MVVQVHEWIVVILSVVKQDLLVTTTTRQQETLFRFRSSTLLTVVQR